MCEPNDTFENVPSGIGPNGSLLEATKMSISGRMDIFQ